MYLEWIWDLYTIAEAFRSKLPSFHGYRHETNWTAAKWLASTIWPVGLKMGKNLFCTFGTSYMTSVCHSGVWPQITQFWADCRETLGFCFWKPPQYMSGLQFALQPYVMLICICEHSPTGSGCKTVLKRGFYCEHLC